MVGEKDTLTDYFENSVIFVSRIWGPGDYLTIGCISEWNPRARYWEDQKRKQYRKTVLHRNVN